MHASQTWYKPSEEISVYPCDVHDDSLYSCWSAVKIVNGCPVSFVNRVTSIIAFIIVSDGVISINGVYTAFVAACRD